MLKKLHIAAFVCCLASCFWPLLLQDPEVASHFGWNGQPNGWMKPGIFIGTMCAVVSTVFTLLIGTDWMIRRLPAWSINLPNKAYWLLPENRARATAMLKSRMLVYGIALLLFLTCVNGLVFLANRNGSGLNLAVFIPLQALFMMFNFVWIFHVIRLFNVPAHG